MTGPDCFSPERARLLSSQCVVEYWTQYWTQRNYGPPEMWIETTASPGESIRRLVRRTPS